jgi:hypothetical protein
VNFFALVRGKHLVPSRDGILSLAFTNLGFEILYFKYELHHQHIQLNKLKITDVGEESE